MLHSHSIQYYNRNLIFVPFFLFYEDTTRIFYLQPFWKLFCPSFLFRKSSFSLTDCIHPSSERLLLKARQPVWAEQTGTSDRVAWRKKMGGKKRGKEWESGYKRRPVEARRGWMCAVSGPSWSPVCSFITGYTWWWVERVHTAGGWGCWSLPQAISHVGAARERQHWQVMCRNYSPPHPPSDLLNLPRSPSTVQ